MHRRRAKINRDEADSSGRPTCEPDNGSDDNDDEHNKIGLENGIHEAVMIKSLVPLDCTIWVVAIGFPICQDVGRGTNALSADH